MGSKVSTIGGGSATGLGNNFVQWLQNGLNTGSFGGGGPAGSGAMTQTQGMAGVLNDILSGGAGKLGGALQDTINRTNTQNINDLRARYGAFGGTGFGTPAAFAESNYRAAEPAQTTTAIGNLQLSALQPLLSSIYGLSQKGIPQAESVIQPSGFSQALQGLGSIAGPLSSLFMPLTSGMGGADSSSIMNAMMWNPSLMGGNMFGGTQDPFSSMQLPPMPQVSAGQ